MDYTDVEPGAYFHWCSRCGPAAAVLEAALTAKLEADPELRARLDEALKKEKLMEDTREDPVNVAGRFYGCHNNILNIGGECWEVREDESDGYRSYLDGLYRVPNPGGFFDSALDLVHIEPVGDSEALEELSEQIGYGADDFEGYKVVGQDGHVWAIFGTADAGDYYPSFRCIYFPKPVLPGAGEYDDSVEHQEASGTEAVNDGSRVYEMSESQFVSFEAAVANSRPSGRLASFANASDYYVEMDKEHALEEAIIEDVCLAVYTACENAFEAGEQDNSDNPAAEFGDPVIDAIRKAVRTHTGSK